MIEILSLQWGFCLNAAKLNFGSDDLYRLADFTESKTSEDATGANSLFAKEHDPAALPLSSHDSRLLFESPRHCCKTFAHARRALRQVYPNMFKDVFLKLFRKLYDQMGGSTPLGSVLASIVRQEFVLVREMLATHDHPNFSSKSKFQLVIGEAQILNGKCPTSFASSSTQGDLRPLLSPILNGFRTTADQGELMIIYCSTGLTELSIGR